MLGVKTYPDDYINNCYTALVEQLASYDELVATVQPGTAADFERRFLANLTLVLDQYFVHRLRTVEGKDGNPLNEVRLVCTSILENKSVLTADKTIKYRAESSVLGLAIGDTIALDTTQFRRLAGAYFDELRHKFGSDASR